jgi:hypothetical protein
MTAIEVVRGVAFPTADVARIAVQTIRATLTELVRQVGP